MLRYLAASLVLLFLAACAGTGPSSRQDFDASQFVQVDAKDFVMIDLLPRGLGSGGKGFFELRVNDEDPRVSRAEEFELVEADRKFDEEKGYTEVTYVLQKKDYKRFSQLQVHLRAQLLSGYFDLTYSANTLVCDEAGVALAGNDAPTVLKNAATGRTIVVYDTPETAKQIKERVAFCT